jgi:FkbM family methyltransferase
MLLLPHPFSSTFASRDNHEVQFRRINTFLINRHIIRRNIIDLGAWIGDNTLPWAKNINGIVYAIDPSPNNCNFINQMCSLNDISNVTTFQLAISNRNELLSTNDNINHCSFVHGSAGVTTVQATTLDYLYEQKQIQNIGYIHLDVEGMEFKVLEGCSHIVDKDRPIITFEQHIMIDDYNVILAYMASKQYTVFLIDEILPGCRPDCRNSIAFPNEIFTESLVHEIHNHIGYSILIRK